MIIPQNFDIFQTVREIPILDAIRRYCPGLELKRQGREYVGLCPFHQERTPSFTVNPDKNLFYCFGCGTGGDSIKFVALLLRLSPLEAARTIAQDFGLVSANGGRLLTRKARCKLAKARRRAAPERELEARFEAAAKRAHQQICLLLRSATKTLTQAILRRDEATIERLEFWLHALPQLEDLLDRLRDRDPATRLAALKESKRWTT
jgi:DNA primase